MIQQPNDVTRALPVSGQRVNILHMQQRAVGGRHACEAASLKV